jgi:hypothetical protein
LFEGPVVGAVEGRFVADEEGDGVAGSGHLFEAEGEEIVGVGVGESGFDFVGALDGLKLYDSGFDSGETTEPPAGDGHGFDEVHFDDGPGLEVIDVAFEEGVEVVLGFVLEDDGF